MYAERMLWKHTRKRRIEKELKAIWDNIEREISAAATGQQQGYVKHTNIVSVYGFIQVNMYA